MKTDTRFRNDGMTKNPSADAMFCFSCCMFLNDEKHTGHPNNRKIVGVNKWRKALDKIKVHSASESHMCGMVRWNTFKKK